MLLSLAEMRRRVKQRILNDDTGTSDLINDLIPKLNNFLNERYERILQAKPWPLEKKYTLQIVASQKAYALNRDVGRIIAVFDKTNGRPLKEIDVQRHIRERAASLDIYNNVQTGDPTQFYKSGLYQCQGETGSVAEKVSVVSSSSSDVSPLIVHIKGLSSSVEVEEDVIVTGTSAAQSSNTYDATQKLQVSIGTNDGSVPSQVGTITVSGVTSSTVLSKISKFSYVQQFQWIEVSPTPKASGTQPQWDIWYSPKFIPMIDDNDVPIFDCCMAIIQGAYSDCLREDGQESLADSADSKFVGLVEELYSMFHNPDYVEQFIPYSRDGAIFDEYRRQVVFDY